jgi:hypothetical protein
MVGSTSGVFAGSLDSNQTRLIIRGASNASYVPPGWLLYAHQQALVTQKFDAKTLQITGDPLPVAGQLSAFGFVPGLLYSVSPIGVLAFRGPGSEDVQLAWYNRNGKRLGSIGEPGPICTLPRHRTKSFWLSTASARG